MKIFLFTFLCLGAFSFGQTTVINPATSAQGAKADAALPATGGTATNLTLTGSTGTGTGIYLIAGFNTDEEKLRLAFSLSGTSWTQISNTPIYSSTTANTSVRDPDIKYVPSTGVYYIAYTTDGFTHNNGAFEIAQSVDLVNWAKTTSVSTSSVSGLQRTWGPLWFTGPDSQEHILVSTGTSVSAVTNKIWETHPTASGVYTAWSGLTEITGTGFPSAIIVEKLIYKNGTYYLWIKNDVTKYNEIFSSASMLSGYTAYKTGNWAGIGANVEGVGLVQTGTSSWTWFTDDYQNGGMKFTKSADDWATWGTLQFVGGAYQFSGHRLSNSSAIRTSDIKVYQDVILAQASLRNTLTDNSQVNSLAISAVDTYQNTTAVTYPFYIAKPFPQVMLSSVSSQYLGIDYAINSAKKYQNTLTGSGDFSWYNWQTSKTTLSFDRTTDDIIANSGNVIISGTGKTIQLTGTSAAPSNAVTPVAFRDILISGTTFKMPLYQ